MGFPVPKRKEPYCYNGVPTASILHAAKSRHSGKPEKVKATVGTSLGDMFKFGPAFQGMLTVLWYSFGTFCLVLFLMHLLNIWTAPADDNSPEAIEARAKEFNDARRLKVKQEIEKTEAALK